MKKAVQQLEMQLQGHGSAATDSGLHLRILSWATAACAAMRKGPLARLAKTSLGSAPALCPLLIPDSTAAILHRFPHGPGHLPAVL